MTQEEFRGLADTIDSGEEAVAFSSDVLRTMHKLIEKHPAEEPRVSVEITVDYDERSQS